LILGTEAVDSITQKTFAPGASSNPDLQKVPARSVGTLYPVTSTPTSTDPVEDVVVGDSIVLGRGVPNLDVMTRHYEREMAIELETAARRAEENARLQQQLEQQKAAGAEVDARLEPAAKPQTGPEPKVSPTPMPVKQRDVRVVPLKTAAAPAVDLLNRVKTGLRNLDAPDLAAIHRINFSTRA
jgi:hypothetical protein